MVIVEGIGVVIEGVVEIGVSTGVCFGTGLASTFTSSTLIACSFFGGLCLAALVLFWATFVIFWPQVGQFDPALEIMPMKNTQNINAHAHEV